MFYIWRNSKGNSRLLLVLVSAAVLKIIPLYCSTVRAPLGIYKRGLVTTVLLKLSTKFAGRKRDYFRLLYHRNGLFR